jgi:probable rRNA maturation factor
MPGFFISIDVTEPDSWPAPAGRLEEIVREAALAALELAGPPEPGAWEVSVTLTSSEAVRALNARWRGKDAPTNVLSFPAARDMPAPPGVARTLGDLVMAGPVVRAEAEAAGVSWEEHLAGLIVHGILHLLGHDHQNPRERREMEDMERRVMARLGFADPYAGYED